MRAERLQAAEVAYRMGNILSFRGKADQATALYHRAIRLAPTYVPPYLELESLLTAAGRADECIALYRSAAESAPGEPVFATRLEELLSGSARSEGSHPGDPPDRRGFDRRSRAHLLLYADCSGISGAEQANHAIAMGLLAGGYRVTFAQARAGHHLVQERAAAGIPHVWIGHDDIYRGAAASPSLCSPAEGRAVLGQVRPDLVLFCDGCPVSSLGAKHAAVDLGLPSLALVHCATREWAARFATHLTSLRAFYRSARQVATVSRDNLDVLRDAFGLPAGLGIVIHNGVSPTFFEKPSGHVRSAIRSDLGIPDGAVVCLTVARMEPVKGYQFLVKAIRALRRTPAGSRLHFIWIGSGSMEPRTRAMIDHIGAARHVHLVARTSRVQDYLDAADMFVLPSLFEGMPLSVMEAMAKGLPVAATAVSGTPEELGRSGVLLPDPRLDGQRTIASLTDVLEGWAGDEDLRRRIGAECRHRAARMFTRDRMVADHLRLVDGALRDRSAGAPLR